MVLKLAFLLVLAFSKVYADEPDSVLGGTVAIPGELPYQVSLQLHGIHLCGGTIVSSTHIITAAHCLDEIVSAPWKSLSVVSGSVSLNSGGQTHRVKNVRIHPLYMSGSKYSWANDAALIYLQQPIQFNAYQRAVPLATYDPPLKAPFTVSGWGSTEVGGDNPDNLQKATVYYVSNEQCQSAHPRMPIYNTHICALHSRGIGACHGDSGGPLVHEGRLVGIASWVIPCALGRPDVYTRVSEFSDFFSDVRNS